MKRYIVILIFLDLLLFSCTRQIQNEIVMSPGMAIKATNANGTITIIAENNFKRVYQWGNHTLKANLIPRKQRLNGSLGIYLPKGDSTLHTILEEGQQHFYSTQEALNWLEQNKERYYYVYNHSGLVIGWNELKDKNSPMSVLSVEIWQIYVSGKNPFIYLVQMTA